MCGVTDEVVTGVLSDVTRQTRKTPFRTEDLMALSHALAGITAMLIFWSSF